MLFTGESYPPPLMTVSEVLSSLSNVVYFLETS